MLYALAKGYEIFTFFLYDSYHLLNNSVNKLVRRINLYIE